MGNDGQTDSMGGNPSNISTGNISAQDSVIAIGTHIEQHISIYPADKVYDVRGLKNPYPGLRNYTYKDRSIYAGRESTIEQAVELLAGSSNPQALLFITGASGAGKSSFAQAGLLPALIDYYKIRNLSTTYAVFHPGSAPLLALADAIIQLTPGLGLANDVLSRIDSSVGFNQFFSDNTPRSQVNLIVLDQFEEIFTQADGCAALIDILTNLAPFTVTRTHIIATMRVDYLPQLFSNQQLYEASKLGVDLRVMNVEELAQAIEKPVQEKYPNKQVASGLITQLTKEASEDAACLPLLQVTLSQLWRDGLLMLELYMGRYGSLGHALEQRAEDVYAFVDYDGNKAQPRAEYDQKIIMQLFTDLVQVSLDTQRSYARCQREYNDLTRGQVEREHLLNVLVEARLLSTESKVQSNPASQTANEDDAPRSMVNIIHESLIQNWGRLKEAITIQHEQLARRVRFQQNLDEWLRQQQRDGYLLKGFYLAEARELAEQADVVMQNPTAKALLQRSAEAEENDQQQRLRQAEEAATADRRTMRRTRIGSVIITVILIVAIIASFFAYHNLVISDSHRLALDANNELQSDPELATLLAYEGLERDDNSQSESAMRDILGQAISPVITYTHSISEVKDVAFSPDGKRVLIASQDGTARISSIEGQPIITFTGHLSINSAAFSPDAKYLATGGEDNFARLWDASSGKCLVSMKHTRAVNSVAFSNDGSTILTASYDRTARMWATGVGQPSSAGSPLGLPACERAATPLLTLGGKDDPHLNSAVFSPNQKSVLAASSSGVIIWDIGSQTVITRAQIATLPLTKTLAANRAVFSPNGKHILTAADDGTARVWDTEMHPEVVIKAGLRGSSSERVISAVFSPDGNLILTALEDGRAQLWSSSGQLLTTMNGQGKPINAVAFSPDGRYILTGSFDRTAKLWQSSMPALWGSKGRITHIAFSKNGDIATAAEDGVTLLWNKDDQLLATFAEDDKNLNDVQFSPDGTQILTASNDHNAYLWDIATGNRKLLLHDDVVNRAVFSPDGSQILTASADHKAKLWDINGKLIRPLPHDGAVFDARFSPDGKHILTASADTKARLWDQNDDQPTVLSGHIAPLSKAEFSPDGERIVTAATDGSLMWWNGDGSGPIAMFAAPDKRAVESLKFSPDSRVVATASDDKTARLWSRDGQLLNTLTGHADLVYRVRFSADNYHLITVSNDGATHLWNSNGNLLAVIPGYGLDFDPSGSHIYIAQSSDTALHDYRVQVAPVEGKSLLPIAACHVGRSLSSGEVSSFEVGIPRFDYSKRQCPPDGL